MPRKKQPGRNLIQKLRREREALLKDVKEVKVQKTETTKEKVKASNELQLAENIRKAHQEELRKHAPYHPYSKATIELDSKTAMTNYALECRFIGPFMEWNDFDDRGILRLFTRDNHGKLEQFGYAVSGGVLHDYYGEFRNEFIKDMGESIAAQLFDAATAKMGYNMTDYHQRQIAIKKKYLS